MAEIIKRKKAMSVSPLKSSQPIGASLAFLGINQAMPLMHGSQGCTAFAKVFFVRHFREPIPLQTTAMDQVSTVLGADESIVEALDTICKKSAPAMIGLCTTGLSETQGADIRRMVKVFRERHPEHAGTAVVAVPTPDFTGCMESGYAAAVHAMIEQLVPDVHEVGPVRGEGATQVNVLPGSLLTPGDVETLKLLIESFGLQPVMIPDLSGSLDGHLGDSPFSAITTGGLDVSAFRGLSRAAATIVVGGSMNKAADLLRERTGVQDFRFETLMGLEPVDRLVAKLAQVSGRPVPDILERQRRQLQDAMLDTHFMLGLRRVAIAADPDHLLALTALLNGMGAEVVAAVAPMRTQRLTEARSPAVVQIGDLEDLERMAREAGAEVLVGNSHLAESALRLNLPLLRAGFPQYDHLGGYQRTWIGYQGTRQILFDLANLLLAEHGHHEIRPYRSIYAQPGDAEIAHGAATPTQTCTPVH